MIRERWVVPFLVVALALVALASMSVGEVAAKPSHACEVTVAKVVHTGEVVRVVDGDTLELRVDLGYRVTVSDTFRLVGVDTPERYGVKKGSPEYVAGIAASDYVKQWVADHGPRVLVYGGEERGKYGRWLARVCAYPGTPCLNDDLITSGHGKAYGGGKR